MNETEKYERDKISKKWTLKEFEKLVYMLGETNARNLLEDHAEVMFTSKLVNNLFLKVRHQAEQWAKWLAQFPSVGLNQFDLFDETGLITPRPPEWPNTDAFCHTHIAPVLVLRGPSAWREVQFYRNLLSLRYKRCSLVGGIKINSDHIGWAKGCENTRGDWHFEWQMINFGTDCAKDRDELVRERPDKAMPSCAVFASAALNKEWLKSLQGKEPYMNPMVKIPGYTVSTSAHTQETNLFVLRWDNEKKCPILGARRRFDHADADYCSILAFA